MRRTESASRYESSWVAVLKSPSRTDTNMTSATSDGMRSKADSYNRIAFENRLKDWRIEKCASRGAYRCAKWSASRSRVLP